MRKETSQTKEKEIKTMMAMEVRAKERELSARVNRAYDRLMDNLKTDVAQMYADAEYRKAFKEWSRVADEALKSI